MTHESIAHADMWMALGELVLALFKDLENRTGIVEIECRLIWHATMIGTLTNRPMSVSKLSMATGMSRASVRRHVKNLLELGAVTAQGQAFVISPAFANSEAAMGRVRIIKKHVQALCETFNSHGGVDGH